MALFSLIIIILGTQIHDLVSQIKVPVTLPSQPVSKTLLTTNNVDQKRRKIDVVHRRGTNHNIAVVTNPQQQQHQQQQQQQKARRVLTTTTGTVATHIVVEDNTVNNNPSGPRPHVSLKKFNLSLDIFSMQNLGVLVHKSTSPNGPILEDMCFLIILGAGSHNTRRL